MNLADIIVGCAIGSLGVVAWNNHKRLLAIQDDCKSAASDAATATALARAHESQLYALEQDTEALARRANLKRYATKESDK